MQLNNKQKTKGIINLIEKLKKITKNKLKKRTKSDAISSTQMSEKFENKKKTYLPKKALLSKNKEQKRFSARIWKYRNIPISINNYANLKEFEIEKLKEHFIKEISEIVIAKELPFANLSETHIETLIRFFDNTMSLTKKPLKNTSLLDHFFEVSYVFRNWLVTYYKKNLIRNKFFLGDKKEKKKKRRVRIFKNSYLRRILRYRKAKRKGYLKLKYKKSYLERINRRLRRQRKPLRKFNFGFINVNIKRRNAFLTVGKKVYRKKNANKFETRLHKTYRKTYKSFSIGQLKTSRVVQNPV